MSRNLIGIAAVLVILVGAWFFVVSPMLNSGSNTALNNSGDAWNVQMSDDGHYEITVTPALDPIALNEPHDWVVYIEDEDGEIVENAELSISGRMPIHAHGLPTSPESVGYIGEGEYRIAGMQFQMPGEWVVDLVFSIEDHQHSVKFVLTLEN